MLPLFILRTLLIFLTALNLTISGYDYRLYKTGSYGDRNYMYLAYATGDLNGDGQPDVVMVNPLEAVSGVSVGAVYVYFGKTGQDFSSYDLKLYGVNTEDEFGSYVNLTDVNNDGFDDLLIGSPKADDAPNDNKGAVYLVCGRPAFASKDNAINTIYNARLFGPENNSKFGTSGSFAQGDVNRDGYKDFLIGAPRISGVGYNGVYLFLGNNAVNASSHTPAYASSVFSVLFTPDPRTSPTRTVGRFGMDFCDLDNDSYDDIIVGDYLYDALPLTDCGAAWIKYCSSTFPGSTLGQTVLLAKSSTDAHFLGEAAEDRLGFFLFSADIDGDGKRDLLLNAPTNSSNGQVYVIRNPGVKYSAERYLAESANYDAKYIGASSLDRLGLLSTAFDVNRDSKADLFLSSSYLNAANASKGRIYLINGAGVFSGDKVKLLSNTANYLMHFGETCPEEVSDPDLNYRLLYGLAADINADGYKDMFLSDSGDNGGHCFVLLGRVPSVAVTAPNGGETYNAGETKNITWTMTTTATLPADANPISLEYSTDGGTTYTTIATGQPNTGTYAWTVPAVNSTTARVRVTGANVLKLTASDASDANFTIVSPNPTVSILAPNGGEAWPSGSLQQIKWSANGGAAGLAANPISIHLSLDSGGTFATRIAEGLANSGTYDWTVPSGLDIGTARIRVTAVNNQGLSGTGASQRDFAITTVTGGGDVRVLEIKSGPSPFSPGGSSGMGARAVNSAQIDYKLSSTANASVYIFDSTGNLKWKQEYTAGANGAHVGMNSVPWDGADSGGTIVPNGVYIIKIVSGGKVIGTDKIMIIK